MRHYILPFLIIAMLNSIPIQIFKRKFGETLPMTLFCIPSAMYISQFLFHTFSVAVIGLCVAALVGTIALLLRKIDSRLFFTNGLIAFLVVCFILLTIDFHRTFSDFDEFWHWGPMVKEMLRLDKFYCVEASRMVIHKDYPPFLALIELFWTYIGGTYQEGTVSQALHIFFFTLVVVPIIERMEFVKKPLKYAAVWSASLCIFFLVLIGAFDRGNTILTILADVPLAVIFAFSIFLILSGEAYDSVFGQLVLVLSGIVLVMTKQAGITILPVLVCLYAVVGITQKRKLRAIIITSALFLLIPLCVYFGWSSYVSTLNINDLRAAEEGTGLVSMSKIDLSEYLGALQRQSPGLQQDTLWNYIRALFERNISVLPWLPTSYVTSYALVVILLIFLSTRFSEFLSKKTATGTGIVLFFGMVIYAAAISVVFVFCFTTDEMQGLSGYERYASSFVLGQILALVMMLVIALGKKKDWFQRLSAAGILVLVAVVLYGTSIINIAPRALMEESAKQYHDMARVIIANTEPDSTTQMVYDASNHGGWFGYAQSHVSYYANDRDIPYGMDLYKADYSDEDKRAAALNQLNSVDYLYVLQTNEQLNDFFAMYDDGAPLEAESLYRVNHQNSNLTIERI